MSGRPSGVWAGAGCGPEKKKKEEGEGKNPVRVIWKKFLDSSPTSEIPGAGADQKKKEKKKREGGKRAPAPESLASLIELICLGAVAEACPGRSTTKKKKGKREGKRACSSKHSGHRNGGTAWEKKKKKKKKRGGGGKSRAWRSSAGNHAMDPFKFTPPREEKGKRGGRGGTPPPDSHAYFPGLTFLRGS